MKATTLITVNVPIEKKEQYKKAVAILGTTISQICRAALDHSIELSKRIENIPIQKRD